MTTRPLETLLGDLKARIDALERRMGNPGARLEARSVDLRRGRIRGLSDPIHDQDAVTKVWVEELIDDSVGTATGSTGGVGRAYPAVLGHARI